MSKELHDEINRLRHALHRISLGSQSPYSSKEDLGDTARRALSTGVQYTVPELTPQEKETLEYVEHEPKLAGRKIRALRKLAERGMVIRSEYKSRAIWNITPEGRTALHGRP